MADGNLDQRDLLLRNLLETTLKLRYENSHMRGILDRMGIKPNFPEYIDLRQKERTEP